MRVVRTVLSPTVAQPLEWEQRDWRKPYEESVSSHTWHAELPVHGSLPLYEIKKFDEGFFVWFCAATDKVRIAGELPTLEAAKEVAQKDWQIFVSTALGFNA